MIEKWKEIKEFKKYKISSEGRIKSFHKYAKTNNRILKKCLDKNGYEIIHLSNKKFNKIKKVHRLVAIAFIQNIKNKPQINHKNGIKIDNSINNLEWCTLKENLIHARIILNLQNNGENNPNVKINYKIAKKIKKEYLLKKITRKKLGEKYKISKSTIDRILTNKYWTEKLAMKQ